MRAPAALVRAVHKRYGRVQALSGLSLAVHVGETLGLLGPNGAGKSTLMHILAGVLRPDAGQIHVGGAPVDRAARRRVGFAPQTLSLYPQLSAVENLRFFARVQGVTRSQLATRVEAALRVADLGDRARDWVGTYSGGMQRRLNLACALLHRPELLLLDEPTAGVDPQSRQHLYDAIAHLREEGLTVVISTHLIDEAERLCDRVAVIDRGQLADVGTPAELRERHAAPDLQGALLLLTGRELRD